MCKHTNDDVVVEALCPLGDWFGAAKYTGIFTRDEFRTTTSMSPIVTANLHWQSQNEMAYDGVTVSSRTQCKWKTPQNCFTV